MERTATDVASPPISGGDLPSFNELLAKGSFQARLARARAEREKALARSGDAADDEFILNTGRKPWEKGPGAVPKRDRLTDALGHSVAVEDRVARPLRPPVMPPPVTPRPEPKPVLAPTAVAAELPPARFQPLAPAESLVVVPAKPTRKRLQVAAGFGAGLILGAAAAIVGLVLRDAGPAGVAPTPAPVVSVPVSVAQAPSVATAAPDLAALSAAVEALPALGPSAPRPLPVLLARPAPPEAADAAPRGIRSGPFLAGAGPLALEAPAAALQPPPARPTHLELVVGRRPAAVPAAPPAPADALPSGTAAPPPRPRVGAGTEGLAALAPVDAAITAAAALTGWAAPLPGRLTAPRILAGDTPLAAQPLPTAYSAPEVPVERPPAVSLIPGPVILHAPASVADAELAEAVSRLGAAGVPLGEPSRVDFTVSESNVRYFHATDAEAAAAVAEAIGARLRDFTSFAPAPPAGTIEVWLAGKGASGSTTARTSTKRTRNTQDPRLLNLRNRILQQLRNGDHL